MNPVSSLSFSDSYPETARFNDQYRTGQSVHWLAPEKRKDRITIHFKGDDAIPDSIVNKVKKLVKKCHYGKDIKHLTASDTNFGVKYTSGESLEFVNYMNKLQENSPFKGTCEELAFSLAGYMEKSPDFKDYSLPSN